MLDLSDIVNISVSLPSEGTTEQTFSETLFLSTNTVIPTSQRVATYTSVEQMVGAGFSSDSSEIKAATLYFTQFPKPSKLHIGTIGKDETAVGALTACRIANTSWYIAVLLDAVSADIKAAANYIESATPASVLFYTTNDADVLTNADGNVCADLKKSAYKRTMGQYSTYPNAAASIAGYACGANNGQLAFALDFKPEPGVTAEPLNHTQTGTLDLLACNYLTSREDDYTLFMRGQMASGIRYDEILGIDILQSEVKLQAMNVLTSERKVPQTDAGVGLITAAITKACEKAVQRGFIAPGIWNGANIGALESGTALPNGYSVQVGKVADLSTSDIKNRIAPPIYVCIILAGSLESLTIAVNVNS